MFRPSRPMIRPLRSSDASSTTDTVASAVWLAATRWSESATSARARRRESARASSSICRTSRASSWRTRSVERSRSCCFASCTVRPESRSSATSASSLASLSSSCSALACTSRSPRPCSRRSSSASFASISSSFCRTRSSTFDDLEPLVLNLGLDLAPQLHGLLACLDLGLSTHGLRVALRVGEQALPRCLGRADAGAGQREEARPRHRSPRSRIPMSAATTVSIEPPWRNRLSAASAAVAHTPHSACRLSPVPRVTRLSSGGAVPFRAGSHPVACVRSSGAGSSSLVSESVQRAGKCRVKACSS